MEMMKRYKKTEVGVIPEDWEVKKLSEISLKITVGIASAATHAYRSKGIVLLRNQNIKNGKLDDHDLLYIDEGYEETFKNKRLKEGDLLTARTGYPGATCLIPKKYDGAQSFTTLISRPNREIVWSEFLNQYINSEIGQSFFETNQIGGGQKNVNAGTLKQMPIPLPPTLTEQRAIATALTDVDNLIIAYKKLIAKKKAIKQGAMQELLTGKRRLEGFGGRNKFIKTELGLVPEDWEIKELGELGDCIIGLTYSPNEISNDGVLVLRSSNIGDNTLQFEDNVYVNTVIPEKLRLKEGDLLICVRNGSRQLIGKCAYIDSRVVGQSFGAFMSIFRTHLLKYAFYLFQTGVIKKQINENLGATINQITNKTLNGFKVVLPPTVEERNAIVELLSDMDAEITALEQQRDKYNMVKHGMMQELLTGKTRLI